MQPQFRDGAKPVQMQRQTQNKMTTALVTLTPDDIKNRVSSTNSFTKEEMLAHGTPIAIERKSKRAMLAKLTGIDVGGVVDKLREDKNAVMTKMVTRTTATTQKWVFEMTAKRNATPADLLKEKAARAQKLLNKYEAELDALKAAKPVAPTQPAVTAKA